MIKINKLIILLLISLFVLSGCQQEATPNDIAREGAAVNVTDSSINETSSDITVLKFNNTISTDEIKKLNGKQVQITGFIGGASPLDGSYAYIMNIPYQSCAFCIPNTDSLGNTLAAYPPK